VSELSRRYGELDLPVIVLAGEGDRIVHVDRHAEQLVKQVKGAELRSLPGLGHMLHYSAPEAVVDAVATLVSRAAEKAAR
jgi:pimeloyl-ACP methyl ester carboxylesterase